WIDNERRLPRGRDLVARVHKRLVVAADVARPSAAKGALATFGRLLLEGRRFRHRKERLVRHPGGTLERRERPVCPDAFEAWMPARGGRRPFTRQPGGRET